MKPSTIKRGMLIEGTNGQVREVLRIIRQGRTPGTKDYRHHVVYAQVRLGHSDRLLNSPDIGEVREICLKTFAEWGIKEATPEYRFPGRKPFAFEREIA